MKNRQDGSQLNLDFSPAAETHNRPKSAAAHRVVPFVDSATLEARRDAVRRVASSGIFALPRNLRAQ